MLVLSWLASSAILSTGTPLADSTDTNVCGISRGAHAFPSPAFSVSPWNARITLLAFSAVRELVSLGLELVGL